MSTDPLSEIRDRVTEFCGEDLDQFEDPSDALDFAYDMQRKLQTLLARLDALPASDRIVSRDEWGRWGWFYPDPPEASS